MKTKMQKRLAVLTAACIAVVGFALPANAAEDNSFTDEQIVRGLVFGEGEFAAAIDTDVEIPAGLDTAAIAEYQTVKDTITEDLMSGAKGTVSALANLRSGDPYRVLEGFDSLVVEFDRSLQANYPEAVELDGGTVTPQVCGPTVCAAAVAIAIAVVTAIAGVNFNVAGNVNMIYNQNGLWTTNGVWISGSSAKSPSGSFDNLPSVDPSKTVEDYPDLVRTEVAARVAATL